MRNNELGRNCFSMWPHEAIQFPMGFELKAILENVVKSFSGRPKNKLGCCEERSAAPWQHGQQSWALTNKELGCWGARTRSGPGQQPASDMDKGSPSKTVAAGHVQGQVRKLIWRCWIGSEPQQQQPRHRHHCSTAAVQHRWGQG